MNISPFTKSPVKFGKEQGSFEKLKESSQKMIIESFMDAIPSDDIKQLPKGFLFPTAWTLFLLLAFTFVAIFLYGYNDEIHEQFLTPTSQNDHHSNHYCETIETINTGTYMCSQSGIWQSSPNFVYADASYVIQLSSFSVSYSQYKEIMNGIYNQLVDIGNSAMNYDLSINLVYWTFLKFVLSGNSAQSFMAIGTPLTIFNRQKTAGAVSNVYGECNITSQAIFDASSGLMSLTYNYNAFVNEPTCSGALNPLWFDYLPLVNGETFTIDFDIRTLIAVVAVELGILSLSSITEISSYRSNFTYDGVNYQIKRYIDDAYPDMEAFNCIFASEDRFACVLKISSYIIAYPVFNHAGSSSNLPEPCNCETLTAEELSSSQNPCNLFNLLSSFIYFDSASPFPMIDLMRRYDFNMTPVNSLAFNSSFVASYYGQSSPDRELFNDPVYRANMYEYCNNCSLVTFTSFDVIQSDWSINGYFFQVQYGACRNTFVQSYAEWELLIETPFTSLNEPYEQCHNDPTTVLFNQIGVSVGNVAVIAPLCIVLVLFLLSVFSAVFNITIPKSYSQFDKDRALNHFAIGLLLAQDKKWYDCGDPRKAVNSTMIKLTDELADHSEDTSKPFQFKQEDEQGIDWGTLYNRIFGRKSGRKKTSQATSPLHTSRHSSATVQATSTTIKDSSSVSSSSSSSLQNVEMTRASNVTDLTVLSVMSAPQGVTVLNKPPMRELEKMIFEWVPVTGIVVKIIECVAGFASISLETGGCASSVDYWAHASRTFSLCSMRLIHCTPEERRYFYSKLKDLVVVHTSVLMNCSLEKSHEMYGSTVAYFVNQELLTLNVIHTRANEESGK